MNSPQSTLDSLQLSQNKYDAKKAGQRLLEKPDFDLIRVKFDGSYGKYAACVIANFGELLIPDKYQGVAE